MNNTTKEKQNISLVLEQLFEVYGFELVLQELTREAKKRALVYSKAKTFVEVTWFNYYSHCAAVLATVKWQ